MTNDLFDNQPRDGNNEDSHLSFEALSAYLDGELSADERGVATAHLSTCQLCQSELQGIRATTTLMRSLPDMRPAKSFHIGPEYAKNARGTVGSSWLSRGLGLMPALRAATAAVAMLLVFVVAGDVLTNQNNGNQEQSAITTNVTSTASDQNTAPTSTPANSLMIESEAPIASSREVDNVAPAGAAAPNEAAKEESATEVDSEVSAMQAQEDGADDESRAAEPAQTSSPALQPAAPAPTVTVEPSPTPEPTATPQPTATAEPSEASGTTEGSVSNWRIAEIALGLLLAWLVVTLIGLRRLRHD